ncbi:MAG: hypothetical protein HQK84_03330 [Nitrospinae bacterium]|nr:hypothetical protein [Nitrospinota bacterium]
MVKSHGDERQRKRANLIAQVRFREMNASEPLMKRRNPYDSVKTDVWSERRDECGDNLFIVRVAGGVEVA